MGPFGTMNHGTAFLAPSKAATSGKGFFAGLVPPIENYADDGVATMCSHCRRVQRLGQPAAWDWVPELLLKSQILTTFRLCAFCQAYHYPQQMM